MVTTKWENLQKLFACRKDDAWALEEFLPERFDRSFLRLEYELAFFKKFLFQNFKVATSPFMWWPKEIQLPNNCYFDCFVCVLVCVCVCLYAREYLYFVCLYVLFCIVLCLCFVVCVCVCVCVNIYLNVHMCVCVLPCLCIVDNWMGSMYL